MSFKRLYISVISFILIAAQLFSAAGCSDAPPFEEDTDCFDKFMSAIAAFDFHTAYGYLSRSSTTDAAPTPSPTPKGATEDPVVDVSSVPTPAPKPSYYILEEDFVKKYTNIFEGLGVYEVSYEKLSEESKDGVNTVAFTMTYRTSVAGDITNNYVMRLVLDELTRRVEWTPALIFPDMSWGYTVRISSIPARRGDILADGELLARTVTLNAIVAKRDEIVSKTAFCERLAGIIGRDEEYVMKKIDDSKSDTVLIDQINDLDLTADMREELDRLKGVEVLENYGTDRYYPQGETLAHTVGYVGYVDTSIDEKTKKPHDDLDSLNEGRSPLDGLYDERSIIGKSGIEKAYEKVLRGKDGLSVTIRDENGEYVSTLFKKPVEHGLDVHLTVDLDIQRRAEEVLDLVLWGEDTSGAVVVMDPKTGVVKAMASYPTFDLNKIAISADTEYYNTLSAMKNKPFNNRPTLGLYPPGSAIKSFTAAAALELGTVKADFVFQGEIVDDYWTPKDFGAWHWPPIKRTKVKNRTEPLNMTNAMLHSDNIYFAYLALLMGEENFLPYLKKIGFEQAMPFELSVGKSTLKVKYDTDSDWNKRSVAETGYGQGQVQISPLQLAAMYCAFKNGGDIPEPRITDSFYKTEGVEYYPVETFENKVWIEDAIKQSTIDTLLPMMRNIMDPSLNGTGKYLRARGCTVAGKTGTAEIGSDKSREISWFVGFRMDVAEVSLRNRASQTGISLPQVRNLLSWLKEPQE